MATTKGFADTTSVPVEKTRAEIETTIKKYGATAFQSGWDSVSAWVMFAAADRMVKFRIVLPDPKDKRFTHAKDRYGWERKLDDAKSASLHEQSVRTMWRRLLLCIKAKLESVSSGIESFETAFMAHIVLPDGSTAGDIVRPMIDTAYSHMIGGCPAGPMPKMLGGHEEPRVLPHPTLETG